MSVQRRRRKAAERKAAHNRRFPSTCPRCGGPGSHFAPPSLGQPGVWACVEPPIRVHLDVDWAAAYAQQRRDVNWDYLRFGLLAPDPRNFVTIASVTS